MTYRKMYEISVGADLSRPSPIYRPPCFRDITLFCSFPSCVLATLIIARCLHEHYLFLKGDIYLWRVSNIPKT
jgi:hypothetical protein